MNNGNTIDLSKYQNKLSIKNKLGRLFWNIIYWFLFRPFYPSFFRKWRNSLLKLFGAKLGTGSVVHSSARIWAPWNLEMGNYSCLAQKVDCYNVDKIIIGDNTTISQKCYLCTASHDIYNPLNPLITAPIIIEDQAWIATDSFIGMGVEIHQGAVVGARTSVFKNVQAWTVVGGNPAKFIKERVIK